MGRSFLLLFFILAVNSCFCQAWIKGPYFLWGREDLKKLQSPALTKYSEDLMYSILGDAKCVVIFMRNNTGKLNVRNQLNLRQMLEQQENRAYLPQQKLNVNPYESSQNLEIVYLKDEATGDMVNQIKSEYDYYVKLYGEQQVLGILATQTVNEVEEEDFNLHWPSREKREAGKEKENEDEQRTTTISPEGDETDKSFSYVADGRKAILYVNSAPILSLSNAKDTFKLVEHKRAITFDDQKSKGYGRLNIIFNVDGEKLFLRFNFTLTHGNWAMKSVEVEYKEYKTVLPIIGGTYETASAPIGYSYRCSSKPMIFSNGNDSLELNDYQLQPWLNGATDYGDPYFCVDFTTAPILAGLLITAFICAIAAVGITLIMDIKPPIRFESSRSKQLTFTVQD